MLCCRYPSHISRDNSQLVRSNEWCGEWESENDQSDVKEDEDIYARIDFTVAHRMIDSWPKWKQELAKHILRPSKPKDEQPDTLECE